MQFYSKINPIACLFFLIFSIFSIPVLLFPLCNLTGLALGELFSSSSSFTPLLITSLKFSLLQASLSTVLSGILGTIVAFFILESGKGVKSWIWKLSLLSFSLPSLVIVLSLLSFWGNEGLGVSLFGWKGILLCHVAMNYPLFMKMVGESWLAAGTEQEMSGLSLGANRKQLFFYVSLPKMKNAILSASLLCFTYCFCSFIPVSLLGGDPRLATFELNIYQALKFENNINKAAFFALVQLVLLFPLFILFKNLYKIRLNTTSFKRIKIYELTKSTKLGLGFFIFAGLFILSFGPLGLLLVQSLKNFKSLDLEESFSALKNSLKLSLFCLSIVLPVALSGVYLQKHFKVLASWISWVSLLPLFIPVMLLAAALSSSFSFLMDFLMDSFWAVALIQATVALPLITRILSNGFDSIPDEVRKSAVSLGASPFQVFTSIEVPLLLRFIVLGSSLVLCFSLGEVGSLLLFGSSNGPTLSLLIFQKLGKYALKEACALGAILMVLMGVILWGTEKCKPF